jgi:hypothetical protein
MASASSPARLDVQGPVAARQAQHQNRRPKKNAARPLRRAAEILSDVISVDMNDTRAGFLTASVISLQKLDTAF